MTNSLKPMLTEKEAAPAVRAPLAVPGAVLHPMRQAAAKAGIDLRELAPETALAHAAFRNENLRDIGLADYFRVFERLSVALCDESCGLSLRPLLVGSTGLVLSSLARCDTLAEAMKAVATTYNLLHAGNYNRVEAHPDRITYVIDDRGFPYAPHTPRDQVGLTMECVLIYLHGLLSLIAGDALEAHLRKVVTRNGRSGSAGQQAFWSVPIRRLAPYYALTYDIAAASLPVHVDPAPLSSLDVYRQVIRLIERRQAGSGTRQRSVAERLTEAFAQKVYGQTAVARHLGLSVATLRRRLRDENQPGFRTLHDQALNRAARQMLANRRHPADIAEELGFSDLRSFTRAFKRWNQTTPSRYAEQARSSSTELSGTRTK